MVFNVEGSRTWVADPDLQSLPYVCKLSRREERAWGGGGAWSQETLPYCRRQAFMSKTGLFLDIF